MIGEARDPRVCGQDIHAVVFDIGRVLVQWDLRLLFAMLIADPAELEWFTATVVTPEWHFQHDQGTRWPKWWQSAALNTPNTPI